MKIIIQLITLISKKGLKYSLNRLYFIIFWYKLRTHPIAINLLNLLSPFPSFIEVEVTTRCGLRCVMCEHTYWKEPPRDMTYDEFVFIINQFPKLRWIGLTGIGESFLNKDFLKMLDYVKSKKIYVELYDNLFFLDEEKLKKLVDLQIDKLLISCEAASQHTYEEIRPGATFDTVVKNIKFLFDYKNKAGSIYPKISFHFIVMKSNRDEIPEFIEMVSNLAGGPISIQISRMLHEYPEVTHLYGDISEDYIQYCEKIASSKSVKLSWNLDVPTNKPHISHCIEWTMPFVFVTGHVIPCCAANESNNREFQKRTSMGNIFETPFFQIWNGDKYKKLRKMIREGNCPPACKKCCLYET